MKATIDAVPAPLQQSPADTLEIVYEKTTVDLVPAAIHGSASDTLDIAHVAKDYLANLTGLLPDTVSRIGRTPEGWLVAVELVELVRVPATMDVLASYDVSLDDSGHLLGYERTRRYYRSQVS